MLEFIEPYADYILATCHTCLAVVILPLLWSGRKEQHVPYATSLGYTLVLSLLGLALLSQGLVFGAATDMLGAFLWGIVAGERLCQRLGRRSASRRTSSY